MSTPHEPATARNLGDLAAEARACRRCPLWANATQTVFGEGPTHAKVVVVGEQPGDKEDVAGHPFVGPAGAVLDRALLEAGVDRRRLYVTNAVKHFKNEPRGKRRLHKTPTAGEIDICRWWLDQEIVLLRPDLVVAMGASAARAAMRRATPVGAARGKVTVLPSGPRGLVTVHPSLLLRMPDKAARAAEYDRFVGDLKLILREVPSVAL